MTPANRALAKRTAIVSTVVLAILLVCTLFALGWRLWLLLFAAAMVALMLRGLSGRVAKRCGLGSTLSLSLVVAAAIAALVGTAYLLAPRVGAQAQEFVELLPPAAQRLDRWLDDVPGGAWLAQNVRDGLGDGDQFESARRVATTTYNGVVGIIVVAVAGIYLAIDPRLYTTGFVRLFPVRVRDDAESVLHELGCTLQLFMVGRLASMVFVAAATGVAGWVLGVPAPAVLALIAGIFTFIPYAGPIAAAIPIALLSATSGMQTFAWMMLAYTIAQAIEGFVITPLVGEHTIHMPPVITIAAEVLMAALFGPIGVIVSVPLAAAAMVLVRRVYVERILERDTTETTGSGPQTDETPPER